MSATKALLAAVLCGALAALGQAEPASEPDWTHYVRIAGHGLNANNIAAIIEESKRTNVFGIEVDNDIPGRYESFLDPAAKLQAIRAAAEAAHAAKNRAFVYIAGLECITANAAQSSHSFFKDHPDWVQRDRTGRPAVFGGGTAFWIAKGDEDVWISPYAPEWRRRYMQLVRQIAATGIDGVYVDIPYWMTHFRGWEDTWASFDEYTVAAFRKATGIDALHDMRLGNINDSHFRKWIDFRIATITEFMREIDQNVKAANPQCKTIAEIYPGPESAAPRVGADVYQLYRVVDAIAHEYQGPSDKIGASRTAFDWVDSLAGMFTFRSFARGKATWMLNYSWDGEKGVSIPDAMKTLFAAQLTAGANTWDARGHVMSGSNDPGVRREVFGWIAQHEHIFYDPREPIAPVGLYFSPRTRDYHPDEFIADFKGALHALLLAHREFQVITPDTIADFRGTALIVPQKQRIESSEMQTLMSAQTRGLTLVDLGDGAAQFETLLTDRFPGNAARGTPDSVLEGALLRLLSKIPDSSLNQVHASRFVVSQIARVHGSPHVYLFNVKGLVAKQKLLPGAEQGATIQFDAAAGARVYALPFLGNVTEIPAERNGDKLRVHVPAFSRSIVIWCGH
jgi:hypothetical protein